MIRSLARIAAALAIPVGLAAVQVNYGGQSEAFPLLNKGLGARALSMGSAFEAVADDSTGSVYNPAAPGFGSTFGLGLHHEALLASTSRENLSLNAALGPWGGIGLQGAWVSYPGITLRDSSGNSLGNYQPTDQALGLAWAKAWTSEFSLGFSGRGMREDIPGASYMGLALGAGALWKASPSLNLAAVAQSLPQSSGSSGQAMRYALAGAWHAEGGFSGPLIVAFSMRLDPSAPAQANLGLEKGFEGLLGLQLRAGYSSYFPGYNLGSLDGMSLGAGFEVSSIDLDYAWIPLGDFGSTQQFSLSWNFDAVIPKSVKEEPGAKIPQASPSPAQAAAVTASAATDTADTGQAGISQPVQAAPASGGLRYRVLSDGYVRAKALEQSGQDIPALNAYLQALKVDAKDLPSWRALGAIYQRHGKAEWAKRCFDEAAKLEAAP